MSAPRSKATTEEVFAAFHTEEGFKAVAKRLGMSPNTLRERWKAEFGDEAYKARGKAIQAKAAAKTSRATAKTRTYKETTVTCSKCGSEVKARVTSIARMDDPSTFVCDQCQGDRDCPVCGLRVDGKRGLSAHFAHRREAGDDAHLLYEGMVEDARWSSRVEDEDYVRCRECGLRAVTLARHLKAVHGLTADEYRAKHGDALIRSRTLSRKLREAIKAGRSSPAYEGTKTIGCPSCGASREESKFFAPAMHDLRCSTCREKEEVARWEGKSEPEDYVTCRECDYRAENLNSHIQNAHPGYLSRHPSVPIVALGSAIRDKTALKGIKRSPDFGQKIREAKLLGFVRDDLAPFLEDDGSVDHRAMMKVVKCAWPTLKRYMDDLGLVATTKYIEARQEAKRVTLDMDDLEPFKLKNGKVSIAKAMSGLGYCHITIKKECRRLGLKWAHGNISQRKCLDAASEALGGLSFREEWSSGRFVNPPTGYRFRFDGYFPDVGLVIEFQGWHHYTFPNVFMPDKSYLPEYEKLRERDRVKRELIEAAPDLIFFEVLEDEPYDDPAYLRGRLVELGVVPRVPRVASDPLDFLDGV